MNQPIPLSQKLYLLAIHPEKGGLISSASSMMNYILPGALLLEMYLTKNLSFNQKKVVLADEKTTDQLHRFVIEKIKQKQSPVKISRLLNRLNYSQKHIRRNVQQELAEKRIIKIEPHKFLFFRWNKSRIINKQTVYQLVNEIDNQIFKGVENEEDVFLLSMLKPAGLLKRIFPDREKRNQAISRLKKMELENQVSNAVSEAIAVARAVTASVVISAAAAGARR